MSLGVPNEGVRRGKIQFGRLRRGKTFERVGDTPEDRAVTIAGRALLGLCRLCLASRARGIFCHVCTGLRLPLAGQGNPRKRGWKTGLSVAIGPPVAIVRADFAR